MEVWIWWNEAWQSPSFRYYLETVRNQCSLRWQRLWWKIDLFHWWRLYKNTKYLQRGLLQNITAILVKELKRDKCWGWMDKRYYQNCSFCGTSWEDIESVQVIGGQKQLRRSKPYNSVCWMFSQQIGCLRCVYLYFVTQLWLILLISEPHHVRFAVTQSEWNSRTKQQKCPSWVWDKNEELTSGRIG